MATAAPGISGQRPRHMTSRGKDVSLELPTKPPINPVAGETNQQAPPPPKTSPTSQKTSSKTPEPGATVLQAGDFPPLTDAGALSWPTKQTASQVGNRGEGRLLLLLFFLPHLFPRIPRA
ncbi:hypothetical protein MTO96_043272 [Rhipicephalus appendiculatus]